MHLKALGPKRSWGMSTLCSTHLQSTLTNILQFTRKVWLKRHQSRYRGTSSLIFASCHSPAAELCCTDLLITTSTFCGLGAQRLSKLMWPCWHWKLRLMGWYFPSHLFPLKENDLEENSFGKGTHYTSWAPLKGKCNFAGRVGFSFPGCSFHSLGRSSPDWYPSITEWQEYQRVFSF